VEHPRPAREYSTEPNTMGSIVADLCVLTGMLALLVFVVMSTTRINHYRKARLRMQKITARLLNLK
jgi:hypothetical protein